MATKTAASASPTPTSSNAPKPTLDWGNSSPGTSTATDNNVYKVDLGFGITDANGNPVALNPVQVSAYIVGLAGTNPAAYNKVKAAVAKLTGKSKLDPNYVGGYVSRLAQNIMASQDLVAKTGSLEDWFNKAIPSGAAGATSNLPQAYVSSPTQAKSDINAAFKTSLGRAATDAEVKAFTSILVDAEKKNPSRYVNGTTYGGLDKAQFLADLIASGKYDAKPKAYPGILSAIAKEAADYQAKVEGKKAGTAEAADLSARQAITTTAINNDIHLTPELLDSYLAQVKAGKDVSAIQQDMRNTVSLGMPENVAKMIQAGTDLSAIYAPYRSRMATILELPADQIGMNDPSLRSAITKDGAQTLYDFERNLRKDPRWQYTNNAKDAASTVATQVLKDFGFMG